MESGQKSLTTDQAFDEGIKRYIQIVYPKADLKECNFVNDLVKQNPGQLLSGTDRRYNY